VYLPIKIYSVKLSKSTESLHGKVLPTTLQSPGDTYSKVMRIIASYPSIKEGLLKLLEEDIIRCEEDLENTG